MADEYYDSWMKNKTKEEVVKEIGELKRNIKKKHRALQRELVDSSELLEKQWKPLAEPLKKLLEDQDEKSKIDEDTNRRKRKISEGYEEGIPRKLFVTAPKQGDKRKQKINLPFQEGYESDYDYDDGESDLPLPKRGAFISNDPEPDEMDFDGDNVAEQNVEEMVHEPIVYEASTSGQELIKTPSGRNQVKSYIDQNFTGNVAKEYFLKLIKGGKVIDANYGVRVDGNNWMIGDKILELDVNDMIIDGKKYEGSRGLYELIFMNSPNQYVYTEEDLENYAKILFSTNVYRVGYSTLGKVRSNRGHKYKHIIAPIISREQTVPLASGSGIQISNLPKNPMTTYSNLLTSSKGDKGVVLTDSKPQYIYFDDPNELVDRLRVLYASQQSGNNAHTNEINSIIEELLEMENVSNV